MKTTATRNVSPTQATKRSLEVTVANDPVSKRTRTRIKREEEESTTRNKDVVPVVSPEGKRPGPRIKQEDGTVEASEICPGGKRTGLRIKQEEGSTDAKMPAKQQDEANTEGGKDAAPPDREQAPILVSQEQYNTEAGGGDTAPNADVKQEESPAHSYQASKEEEAGAGAEEQAVEEEAEEDGCNGNTLMGFGKHSYLTYRQVYSDHYDYYVWGKRLQDPGHDLKRFLNWADTNAGETVLTFGKHSGKTFASVTRRYPQYVEWARRLEQPHGQLADLVEWAKDSVPEAPHSYYNQYSGRLCDSWC